MSRRRSTSVVAVTAWCALAWPPSLLAQARDGRGAGTGAPPITAATIDADLRFLSSDLLEGRRPSTRGGRLAAAYIAAQLRAVGLRPGVGDTSYVQGVPLDVLTLDTASVRVTASGRAADTLRWGHDLTVAAGKATEASAARGEVVFVGYGISAPTLGWDDYAGTDVRGKIVLALRGGPPAADTSKGPFRLGGREPIWAAGLEGKREEAERRGAVGFATIFTAKDAPVPWPAVAPQAALATPRLPRGSEDPPPVGARITLNEPSAVRLLARSGLDLAELAARAARPGFRAVSTGIVLDVGFRSRVERTSSENVVGVVPGRDAALGARAVVLTTHWDHLGVGAPVDGDSIYNGAVDNASGVALLLAVARAAVQGPAPRRSLVFVFTTGEESGLLGAKWFAAHPTVPADHLDAAINADGANVWGRTENIIGIGEAKSSLGPLLHGVAARLGLRVTPDPRPEQGFFFRSDHLPLARAGVPAIWVFQGSEYTGRPAGWGIRRLQTYIARDYHRPSDEYTADVDLPGLVQHAEVVRALALAAANADAAPTWNAGVEFAARSAPKTAPVP